MSISITFYGTLAEADIYFDQRLHEHAWTQSTTADKTKALIAATRLIDNLNFKGYRATVQTLLTANAAATDAEIQAAELAQPNEFPRGTDTVVPEAIRRATYELAHALLDNKDPELELETLAMTSMGYGSVRMSYQRDQVPQSHLLNMIPSAIAWSLILPFLRDDDSVKLSRVS